MVHTSRSVKSDTPPAVANEPVSPISAMTELGRSGLQSFSNLVFPQSSTPDQSSEPQTKSAAVALPDSRGRFERVCEWIGEKATSFYEGAKKHCSALLEVRSFSELRDWAGQLVSDTWTGLKSAASEVWSGIKAVAAEMFANRPQISPEPAQPITTALREAVRQETEKKEQEKTAANIDRQQEILHQQELQRIRDLETSPTRITCFSANMIDQMCIGNLKLALLSNSIAPEQMPEVRRFLASLESEHRIAPTLES